MHIKRTLLAATLAVVCAGLPLTALALEEGKLVIWMSADKGLAGAKTVAEQFTKALGVEVIIESPDPIVDKFQQAAATGDGPDLVFWAHDRFGEWAASGLLAPVSPSNDFRASIYDFAWDAVNLDGKTWGYPISVEAIGLIYNKDLLDTPPATFEEIPTLKFKQEGVKPILWAYNDTYFTMPLLMANGGYAFKKTDGSYDPKDTGVNNEGSIKGAKLLRQFIDDKVMPAGVDYGIMDAAMNKGEIAMMISGPWSWSNLKQSGIPFAVAPLPSVDGSPAKPFVGVYSAGINAASKNKDIAQEFLENYLLTEAGLATWNGEAPFGASAQKKYAEVQGKDPAIAATLANAQAGVPMPAIPAMGKFWSSMEPALKSITGGQQSVEDALNDAAKRIVAE